MDTFEFNGLRDIVLTLKISLLVLSADNFEPRSDLPLSGHNLFDSIPE